MPLFSWVRLALAGCLLASSVVHAGRPLTVDDASTEDVGTAHIEGWYARQPGNAHTWTVAPAYAPVDGLELGASVTRDRTTATTSQTLQAKWRITPEQKVGCNNAAVLGAAQTLGQGGTTPYLNGMLSCRSAWGATHVNLGIVRPSGAPAAATWGLAHEREFGAVTLHVEAFGQRSVNPTIQVGARTPLTNRLQLDATVGRSHRETLLSVGLKQSF